MKTDEDKAKENLEGKQLGNQSHSFSFDYSKYKPYIEEILNKI